MKREQSSVAIAGVALFLFVLDARPVLTQQAPAASVPQTRYWAPKLARAGVYVPPNRPHVKLSELKARNAGRAEWQEVLVEDEHLRGEYMVSAPGTKVSKRFHPDTREWWIVVEGQMRVEIEGQASFVATPGSLVQVPRQTIYSMETIGERPSLRFVVNEATATTLHPHEVEPPQRSGIEWFPVRFNRKPASYDEVNRPHINLGDAGYKGGPFVRDDRAVAQIICGYEKDLPPLDPADRGHFHIGTAEFWLILAGQIRYNIENVGVFIADAGDVAYTPPSTFHATRFHGPGPSCRLAMGAFNLTALLDARD